MQAPTKEEEDEDFMWNVQRVNWTTCGDLHTMMTNCMEAGETGSKQLSCRDAKVLYDGCFFAAIDKPTNDCIGDQLTLDRVRRCFSNDEQVQQRFKNALNRLEEIGENNPLKKTIQRNLHLNLKEASGGNKFNCDRSRDATQNVQERFVHVLQNQCQQEHAELKKCIDRARELQKNGEKVSDLSFDCFKQDVKRNFCITSTLCSSYMNSCYRYVLKEKLKHQESYDFENEEDERIDAYGFCLFTDSTMDSEAPQFANLNGCLGFVHSNLEQR